MNLSQPASADKPGDPRAKASPLAVPITIAKWWKNRRRSESVHVTLSEYEGHNLINVRVYATGTDGIDRPTTKGVSMGIDKLSVLAEALAKAEAKARALGLINTDEKAEA
jgi:hypothetical protein